MTISIQDMRRPVRRRLKRVIQQSPDANYRRRANAYKILPDTNFSSQPRK